MYKCPKCKSTRIYQEVSVVAKRNVNTERVYDVNKEYIDGDYTEYLYWHEYNKTRPYKHGGKVI